MDTIYANTNDGYCSSKDSSSFSNARNDTNGDTYSSASTNNSFAIRSEKVTGRGTEWHVNRVFLQFAGFEIRE